MPLSRKDPTDATARSQLLRRIADLEARLAELHGQLPAHSIPPGMIAALDELDEQLAQARALLKTLEE